MGSCTGAGVVGGGAGVVDACHGGAGAVGGGPGGGGAGGGPGGGGGAPLAVQLCTGDGGSQRIILETTPRLSSSHSQITSLH